MGGSQSYSQEELLDGFFQILPERYINVGIDDSLLMYSGTDSTAKLYSYSSQLQSELQHQVPIYIEQVGTALSGFSAVPHAVGVGALVISMILQVAFIATKGSQRNEEHPADMLRRIFADEKASEVRDLMGEYLKRYKVHLRDDSQLVEDTKTMEKSLSQQLTRLKNSMVVDGHMNSRALKHWANGAAFHAQMLLHLARLQKENRTKIAAKRTIDIYSDETSELLKKYKEYKTSKMELYNTHMYCAVSPLSPMCHSNGCYFYDEDINSSYYLSTEVCDLPPEHYIDHIFSKHTHIVTLKSYFRKLQKSFDVLCNDGGTFQIKN